MTETAIVAAIARPVTQVITALVKRLGRSLVFRWRVLGRIRKRSGFTFPRISTLKWLKKLSNDDLVVPPEQGAANLAASLDEMLSVHSSWRQDPERHSKALQIVEQAYVAIYSLATTEDSRTLQEHWSRSRHEVILDRFVIGLGGVPQFTRADRAELLLNQSRARTRVRLRPFDATPESVADILDDIDIAMLPSGAGEVGVVVGAFGSGKSETAETWFRRAAERFGQEPDAPFPLWLHARDIGAQSVASAVASRIPELAAERVGVALVIDGLDEVDGQIASRAIEEAEALASSQGGSSVVLTSRPGILRDSRNQVLLGGLDVDRATQLVERIAGTDRATWSWNPALVASLRSPFFALAAGLLLARGIKPSGQADLMRRLVEDALMRPTSASVAVQSAELERLLVKLAAALRDSGGTRDSLDFSDRRRVLESRLIHQRNDGGLEFSLPIFEQWFAARAALADMSIIDRAVASATAFDNWRWAIAVAGIAAIPDQLDELLARAVRGNPGAGAWLVSAISAGHDRYQAGNGSALTSDVAGRRLLRATRTWIDGLGNFAPMVFPFVDSSSQPINIGVSAENGALHTGWSLAPTIADEVGELPLHVRPFSGDTAPWIWTRSGPVGEGEEWPWVLRRDDIAGAIRHVLEKEPLLGPRGGLWHRESMYRAARVLTERDSWRFDPIPASEVFAKARPFLQLADQNRAELNRAELDMRLGRVRLDILADLVQELEAGSTDVIRLVPAPDLDPFRNVQGYPLAFYSDQQLMAFHAEVLGFACVAYEEAASSVLSNFSWSLGTQTSEPFGIVADLWYSDQHWGDTRMHVLETAIVPQSAVDTLFTSGVEDLTLAANGRAAVRFSGTRAKSDDWVRGLVRENAVSDLAGTRGPFAHWGMSSSIEDRTRLVRPISSFVADWIWRDFGAFSLTKGTFPRLEK